MNVVAVQPAKRELDIHVCKKPLREISVRRATVADISPLIRRARRAIAAGLASAAHVSRILSHNGECIWVVERAAREGGRRPVGFHAFPQLSGEGEVALRCARFAFRQPDLGSRLAFEMVRAGIRLCQKKGYGRLYGHARDGLVGFRCRFGARVKGEGRPLDFSGHLYTEMIVKVPPGEDAVTVDSDPDVIVRPEGQWEYPGVLETSLRMGGGKSRTL